MTHDHDPLDDFAQDIRDGAEEARGCSVIGCGVPAAMMVLSQGMNVRGVMVVVAWADWDEIAGRSPADASLFCEPHARETLAKLPLLAPVASTRADDGDVYTHG